jgi:type II secretory ATPase GspE/PulE/Tfp pilus assembly ATPase PilB-like protein/FixJ family two-component response regulator/RNA polymerase subunit RPABC4/transcription elongation factor Spt4
MAKYSELFKTAAKGGGPDQIAEIIDPDCLETDQGFTLLFVDDEEGVLKALRRIFLDENYTILTADSAEKALTFMEKTKVHLVISDHRMPVVTGAELLKEIKLKWPETIRIMLTGYADVQSVMGAVKDGAVYKFITKPWHDEDLRLTVSLALQQYYLMQENRKLKEITRKQHLKIKNYAGFFDENRGKLGAILLKAGDISNEGLEKAGKELGEDETLGEALVRLGLTTEKQIVMRLQKHLNIESIDLKEANLSQSTVRFLPLDLCKKNRMIPVKLDGRQLIIAMADPSDIYKLDNISLMTGLKVIPLIAACTSILAELNRIHGNDPAESEDEYELYTDFEPLDEIDIVLDEEEKEINVQELIGSSVVPPVIRIVNAIISEAIRFRASDIHIEPKTKYTVVRFRIDGLLHGKIKIPADLHAAVASRIKILAKMDISERRKPQDGRITVKAGTRIVDMRVSSMPTLSGEKMVMRILDKSASIKKLEELGVLPDDLRKINAMIKKPQGVIIATGPTGSGKTTLLYSILNAMIDESKNFATIEEPVEYFLEDANQVSVFDKIGLSFANILRATLRQDPDVILVGEVRDHETADVAFKASLTGHMVLTTLHTNSSVASITRLMDMGVKPYILASALEGIMAQRLVRRICEHCKTAVAPDLAILDLLKISPGSLDGETYRGKGCDKCNNSGYYGRIAVFELFVMCEDFRHFISSNYKEGELLEMARANGMKTLIEDGVEKVKRGQTTLEELLRVIGPQTIYERVCSNCNKVVDAKFHFCPYCGSFRQNYCKSCRLPLEAEWSNCPFCGLQREMAANIP